MLAKSSILTALALALTLFAVAPAGAAAAIYSNWLDRAIGGYDPVAYFTDGKAVEGTGDFTATWMGANWRFATAANRDLFVAAPEKYAPKYGGYCAYAVAQNSTAKIDPTAWAIVDGKLYLNYSHDVQKTWSADRDAYIAAADKNWPDVLK
ncbi:MAG: YHS domain-containing (seleno)protein [Proteobacteria bacterium]|nr:YHS domain-containing (seleno)protein [Pseudomonadota bacterium]